MSRDQEIWRIKCLGWNGRLTGDVELHVELDLQGHSEPRANAVSRADRYVAAS
jgi:hypothetical protein